MYWDVAIDTFFSAHFYVGILKNLGVVFKNNSLFYSCFFLTLSIVSLFFYLSLFLLSVFWFNMILLMFESHLPEVLWGFVSSNFVLALTFSILLVSSLYKYYFIIDMIITLYIKLGFVFYSSNQMYSRVFLFLPVENN